MEAVTVDALTTVAGLALVTGIIVYIIRKTANLSGAQMDRFGAAISMGVGIVLAILATLALGLVDGVNLMQAVLNGLFAGLAASGGFDVINGGRKAAQD
jgi:sugar phosphate permease